MDGRGEKRPATDSLENAADILSPAPKRSRFNSGESSLEDDAMDEDTTTTNHIDSQDSRRQPEKQTGDEKHDADNHSDDDDDDSDDRQHPPRPSAPALGYDDLYLDTIDRRVLDFDFEKLCSVSLSNINVYACLVCGRYFQGRGPQSHAYFHSLDENHHVFIHMKTHKVYVLPDGYEVRHPSLDDIKYVSDPTYTRAEVMALDRPYSAAGGGGARSAWTLDGKAYVPGFVGMNNIKRNDYVNVVVQALSHVTPLRNYFLLESFSPPRSELVQRCALLFRKIWNARAFKSHISPHEVLQEISLRSNKRFTLTEQSDPADFLLWFLNHLHLGLGGSRSKPQSSMIQKTFQGRLRIEKQTITAQEAGDRLRFEASKDVQVESSRFLALTLDLPTAPLFQDELDKNQIPQVPLTTILQKYNGVRAQEHQDQRKRYRLLHPLPPYLIFHIKRFTQTKFVPERNPTIVTFHPEALDLRPYVEPEAGTAGAHAQPILYDLVANIVHEAVRARDDIGDGKEERKTWKVQLLDKARREWVVCQDLFVESVPSELLYTGESYLQIWERRRP